MATIKIHFEVPSTNEVEVKVSLSSGKLFGKWNSPFFYGEGEEAGVCPDPCCRQDKGEDHIHSTGITKAFISIAEGCKWVEDIIEKVKTSQAEYINTRETLRRNIPLDREVIIPE